MNPFSPRDSPMLYTLDQPGPKIVKQIGWFVTQSSFWKVQKNPNVLLV